MAKRANQFSADNGDSHCKWSPKNTEWIEINTDVAKVKWIQKTTISYVCRDSEGHIIKKEENSIGGPRSCGRNSCNPESNDAGY